MFLFFVRVGALAEIFCSTVWLQGVWDATLSQAKGVEHMSCRVGGKAGNGGAEDE
jgi:hypothetical protein